MVTSQSGHTPKKPQSKWLQSEMVTNQIGHNPICPLAETATNLNYPRQGAVCLSFAYDLLAYFILCVCVSLWCDNKYKSLFKQPRAACFNHDNVMTRKQFPNYLAFVRNSPAYSGFPKRQTGMADIWCFYLEQAVNNPWTCRWFQTPWR